MRVREEVSVVSVTRVCGDLLRSHRKRIQPPSGEPVPETAAGAVGIGATDVGSGRCANAWTEHWLKQEVSFVP